MVHNMEAAAAEMAQGDGKNSEGTEGRTKTGNMQSVNAAAL